MFPMMIPTILKDALVVLFVVIAYACLRHFPALPSTLPPIKNVIVELAIVTAVSLAYITFCRVLAIAYVNYVTAGTVRQWHGSILAVTLATLYGVCGVVSHYVYKDGASDAMISELLFVTLPPAVIVACYDLIRR